MNNLPKTVGARLAQIPEQIWKEAGIRSQWAIATAQGKTRIGWLREPRPLHNAPKYTYERGMTAMEKALTDNAIDEFLKKDVIIEANPNEDLFFSNIFVVIQPDKARPCIDARPVNEFIENLHFKMEGIQTLRHMIRPRDFLIKIDIKDAYHHIPIHPADQRYLAFHWRKRNYKFRAMPFGLSSAPRIWTKLMGAVLEPLRAQGIRLTYYIDDICLLATSIEEAQKHSQIVRQHLETLGFIIHPTKCDWTPKQQQTFLGFLIDTVKMELQLPTDKLRKIRKEDSQGNQSDDSNIRTEIMDTDTESGIPDRPVQFHNTSDIPGTISNMELDSRPTISSATKRKQLERDDEDFVELDQGPHLVDQQSPTMERTLPTNRDTRRDLRIGRKRYWVGLHDNNTDYDNTGYISWGMDQERIGAVHQFSGAQERAVRIKDQCREMERQDGPGANGQHHHTSLCQQTGGNDSPPIPTSPRAISDMSKISDQITCRIRTRQGERNRGRPEPTTRPLRLEVESNNLPDVESTLGPTIPGPFCDKDQPTDETVLQLETGPRSGSGRRILSAVAEERGIRQPPMGTSKSSVTQSKNGTMRARANNTPLAEPIVVARATLNGMFDTDPLTTTLPPTGRHEETAPPMGRDSMENSRRSPDSANLAPPAKRLIEASIRKSTRSNYDTNFKHYLSWCRRNHIDPQHASAEERINCLGDLFETGMSTRQLRAVRTAMGRWTPKVNGTSFSALPQVSALIRGAGHTRPTPTKDKSHRWQIADLIESLQKMGDYDEITSRVARGRKTHALLALCTSWRVASDFAHTRAEVSFRGGETDWPAEMVIYADMTKECTPDNPIKESRPIPRLTADRSLCPVYWTFRWLQETKPLRPTDSSGDRLFISSRAPHHNLTPDRLRNWFAECMAAAGIDIQVHKPHSVRAEASTEAIEGGTSLEEVLRSGNWSSRTTFEKHYHLAHRAPVLTKGEAKTSLVATVIGRTLPRHSKTKGKIRTTTARVRNRTQSGPPA